MLLALASVAMGQVLTPADRRATLQDGLLREATGDLVGAIALYRTLSSGAADDDPVRIEALRWLGRLYHEIGEVELAREALLEGVRSGSRACQDLLERIDIEAESIRTVPVLWDFESADHGFFHPWTVQDRGAIRLGTDPVGEPVLEWETDARRRDHLVVGLENPSPAPEQLRFEIRSSRLDVLLQVVVWDELGNTWRMPDAIPVPPGAAVPVILRLRDLVPDPPATGALNASQAWRLVLEQDTTGARAADGSTERNTVWIDDFELK
jgi:hypothetical protein